MLEKNYMVLEIENLLSNTEKEINTEGMAVSEIHRIAAANMYDQLEQLFRLHFEPEFSKQEEMNTHNQLIGVSELNKELEEEIAKSHDFIGKQTDEIYVLNNKLEGYANEIRSNRLINRDLTNENKLLKSNLEIILEGNNKLAESYKEGYARLEKELEWFKKAVGSMLINFSSKG